MKLNMKKVAAAAMAMTMCFPVSALASQTGPAKQGSFTTSFDVYSPALTFTVPVNLDVKVNPMAKSTATDVKKFTVASNSIDIVNASVDVEADEPIPVNVTIQATVESKEGVVSEYNSFTADNASTKKRIYLSLETAKTPATVAPKTGETLAFTTEKKLNLSQFEVTGAAAYDSADSGVKIAPITAYGSLLSLDIAGPSTSDGTTGATYSTDATKVTPSVGSFAVTGVANGNADWKADDVAVAVTYNVKASSALNITTPTIASANAPTFTAGTSAADVTVTVPNVGEATVDALVVHNAEGLFEDFIWDAEAFTVDYTTTAGSAVVKIPKEDEALALFAEAVSGKAQDLVIVLSDGRRVVTTFTATAPTTSNP